MCFALLEKEEYKILLKTMWHKQTYHIKSMKVNAKNYNLLLNDQQLYL